MIAREAQGSSVPIRHDFGCKREADGFRPSERMICKAGRGRMPVRWSYDADFVRLAMRER